MLTSQYLPLYPSLHFKSLTRSKQYPLVQLTSKQSSISLTSLVQGLVQLQVNVLIPSTQKQTNCKKSAALFKIASVKKVVKSKGAAKKWL